LIELCRACRRWLLCLAAHVRVVCATCCIVDAVRIAVAVAVTVAVAVGVAFRVSVTVGVAVRVGVRQRRGVDATFARW
jgi:hypothetical protein